MWADAGVEICEWGRQFAYPVAADTLRTLMALTQDKAYEESQRYKEGKFILEKSLLVDV